jgi:hypothetical protein
MKGILSSLLAAGLLTASMFAAGAQGYPALPAPVTVPLTVSENDQFGTYRAVLDVGVGALKAFPIVFDTGSTGLRLFAVPGVGEPFSGTRCSHTPTSVTYGNPGRITYSGVVCYAYVRIGSIKTAREVPFALLTSASCPVTNPECTIITPQQNYAHGDYGVFGSSLSLGEVLPNPLRVLPGVYSQRFALRLTPNRGDLVLGGPPFRGVVFPLVPEGVGALGIPAFRSGYECVVVNTVATGVCPEVVYDTGNGVPFFYANIPGLPVSGGFVSPGTYIGFTPPCGGPIATTIIAGSTFAGEFRVDPSEDQNPLVNVGIAGFLENEVGFDATRVAASGAGVIARGAMTIAPLWERPR